MNRPLSTTPPARVVLASASPRRRHLLGLFGLPFDVVAADIDESPVTSEGADALACRLSESKALVIASVYPLAVVLAADTVVALNGTNLGKPADATEAREMLMALRGRPHRVLTGLAVARDRDVVWRGVTSTTVWMREYTDAEIDRYVATGRPFDKAGGYAIQDAEFRPVARIDGCYPNVVGLPLCEVRRALLEAGLLAPEHPASGSTDAACGLCVRAREAEPPA